MTRDEANKIAEEQRASSFTSAGVLINTLIALGLLKIDDPVPPIPFTHPTVEPSVDDKVARVLFTYGYTRSQTEEILKALWINDFRIKEREA